MTTQDFIDKCQEKIDELNKKIEEPPIEYSYYNDFVRNYNIKTVAGLSKIPYIDLANALIYPDMDAETLNEVFESTEGFKCLLNELTSDELDEVNQIFLSFVKSGDGDVLEYIFDYHNSNEIIKKVKKIFTTEGSSKEEKQHLLTVHNLIEKLLTNNKMPGWDIIRLVKYYRKSSAGMHNIIAVIRFVKFLKEENHDVNSKEYKERFAKDEKDILDVCSAIEMCRKMINEDYKKYKASLSHELTIYKNLKKNVENAFKKDEITNYEMIIHDIDDEKMRREFLNLVYKHNKVEYDKVEELNMSLKKNSVVNYISILKSYSIKKEEVDLLKVMNNSCEDLDKMLKVLNGIVGDKNTIIRIIEFSNLESVNYFKELKSTGVLGNSAFMRYPKIFDANSVERKVLDKNIEMLKNYNIDFSLFHKAPDVLIENTNLSENIEILYYYELLDNLNNTRKMKFLKKDNLVEIIDKIIELGYEEFLDTGLDLLNENNWDRIYVLKTMGLKPETKEELIRCLRDDKFFIPDNKLSSYIENDTVFCEDLDIFYDTDIAAIVKDYANTKRSLSFDGVIISKNRVARNLTNDDFDINDFFKAIITNGVLDSSEIDTIKSSLKNKTYRIGE
ncbi:MAG: hypothetical protein IK137_03825 [Bacilli bacterium]|nr:hypothetical protein [Bacilli bacterium]